MLTRASRSPCRATVAGTWNSGLWITDVIVPLDRSGLSVTPTSVFAKFSTTHKVLPCSNSPSSVPGTRPATSTSSLEPVTGSIVNN